MGEVIRMKSNPMRYLPGEPRRVRPPAGQQLTLAAVDGDWHPSCSVAALNVFSIVWDTPSGTCWAPLHDFTLVDQQRLLDTCRRYDQLHAPDRLIPPAPRRLN